ncbi:hypothetical protein DPMN_005708 [Dreissena polymorpha]|uniref:Uncharacterized protein n=1 Tax=Dreissena polymorpha TaxID=45954 RepID=A0A9D4MSQ1_DREPO|nr:hypothetical protein DPMN_005708 [Dreissena polymorpha]
MLDVGGNAACELINEDWTQKLTSRFHEDWQIYHYKEKSPVLKRACFSSDQGKLFELDREVIRISVLTKFHEDWPINRANIAPKNKPSDQASLRLHYNVTSCGKCMPPDGHVFQRTLTIFELSRAIIKTNVLTKFHKDWTIHRTSRALTRTNVLTTSPVIHIFQPTGTIFQVVQDITRIRVLTKCNEDLK